MSDTNDLNNTQYRAVCNDCNHKGTWYDQVEKLKAYKEATNHAEEYDNHTATVVARKRP